MKKIAVIGPVPQKGLAYLRKSLEMGGDYEILEISQKEQYGELAGADYVILRTLSLDADDINGAPGLKLIQRWGAGYDTVDIKAAGALGIPVAVTPGTNAGAVSEYAVLLMLCVLRNLIPVYRDVLEGNWKRPEMINRSFTLKHKVVGIIGMGSIGRLVAQKVQAFGAEVWYYDEFRLPQEMEQELSAVYVTLEELAKGSDVISLHIPLLDSTRNLVDKAFINQMKSSAILVNTSRGGIINERDLYDALKEGRILGAALDVFEEEPADMDNPLLHLNNVVVSPHCGANTIDISEDIAQCCIENIKKTALGEKLDSPYLVNGEYLR